MSKKISLPIVNPDYQEAPAADSAKASAPAAASDRPLTRAEGGDVMSEIKREVTDNNVFLYMKGTPQYPQCGFSSRVVQILNHVGANFNSCNILEDMEKRQAIKEYTDWPTIPQLYVKGEFVGGCDIIIEMFQSGELQDLVGAA